MDRAVLHPATLWSLARDTVRGWLADFAPSMGAGIAYYTAFSIGPLLVVVIAIAGVVFGADAVSGYVYAQLADLLGASGAQMVRDMAHRAGRTEQGVVAPIVGVVLLLVGATTVFAELKSDLDRIWKAPAAQAPRAGAWGLMRRRILSLGLVVSVAFVMLVSLVLSAALAALGKWWAGWLEELQWLLHALDFLVSLAAVSLLFALMYKILPSVKIGWRDVWVGAIVTAVLFTLGKFLVAMYIGRSDVASGFGAAGSFVIVLVWVYYSAQIFLLGAEFTWVYAHRFGSRRGQQRPAALRDAMDTETPGRPPHPAR
jgi:membrane protein